MARRVKFIDSLRTEFGSILAVDAGEFSAPPSPAPTVSAKSLYVLEVMKKIGYDAVNPAAHDLQLGLDVLLPVAKDSSVPFVSANLLRREDRSLLFRESVLVSKGKMNVAITGVTMPAVVVRKTIDSLGVEVTDPKTALQKILPELRRKSDLVVVLAHMPEVDARQLGEDLFGMIDILVVGVATASKGVVTPAHGGALYLTAGNRGQALGLVKVARGEGRPRALVGEEIVLTYEYPEDPEIAKANEEFRKYLNEISKITVVTKAVGGRKSPEGHYYVGAQSCASCHAPQFEVWQETPHAHAFATLKEKHAEALPECFKCHVTGAGDPAGYDPSYDQAHELQNVQCEVCHDKGSTHARDGSYGKSLLYQSCAKCHDTENSPDFDAEIYWRMIEH